MIAGYLFAYTPLKTRTSLSTMVGAFPGAVPPLIGWAAARGDIGLEAWVLFAILFLWQFPHFLAIAWMYREDYSRAGILMLPVVEPDGRVTGATDCCLHRAAVAGEFAADRARYLRQEFIFTARLFSDCSFFTAACARRFPSRDKKRDGLLLASVIYLPLLFILMVLNR